MRLECEDSSFVEIHRARGHPNGEENLIYRDVDNLDNLGYHEWLGRIEEKVAAALAAGYKFKKK